MRIFIGFLLAVLAFPSFAQEPAHHQAMASHSHDHGKMMADNAATLPMPEQQADIIANVNGLVCDFCARAFQKVFGKKPEVESVAVDLAAKTIALDLKPGMSLSDEEIQAAVTDAGYTLVSIQRASS